MPASAFFSQFSFYKSNLRYIYLAGFMLFFWSLFDGGFSYLVPLVITDSGYSHTYLGFILGSSSLFGAMFDIVLSKYLPNTHFRRLYFAMFLICAVSPLFIFQKSPIFIYVIAMALWGIYFDLSNFANIDFISRITKNVEHAKSTGIMWVFRSLGYAIAPLVIGLVVTEVLTFTPYFLLWIFLFLSFVFFISLLSFLHMYRPVMPLLKKKRRIRVSEFMLWMKIGKTLFPVLLLTTFCWIFDAFFWTIGPLVGNSSFHLNGLFLTFYTIPPLLMGFFLGNVAKKYGKKRTAQVSCLVASGLLCLFFLIQSQIALLFIVFLASSCMGFAFPALNAAFTDYVSESSEYAKEIEALQDFFVNIGYIIGPIIAGIIADKAGILPSFGYLGIIGVYVVLLGSLMTPKHITVKVVS